MSDLPSGWERVTLADIAEVVSGATPKTKIAENWSGDIPWVTPDDLSRNQSIFIGRGRRSLSQLGYDSVSTQLVPVGSVVFSSRAPIGYVAIADTELCVNQGCKIAVPSSAVYSRFLYWMLKWATPEIQSRASGTTFAEISGKKFAESSVVLPPLAEQHRIVDALEDHNSRIDAATLAVERSQQRVKLWAALSTLNAFRSSAEERWATIGEVCRVHVGATPSRSDPVLWNGDLPWVSSGEVNFRTICDTREQINREKIGKSRIHPPGTVLLAMIGEGKTRGQVAILGVAAAHNQNCASIRVDKSPLDSQYLYHFLKGRYEETRSGGSGGVQPALNKSKVESIKVPIVSRSDQQRVVEAAEEIEATKAKLLRDLSRVSGRADALRMALLRAAFTGQLVDQDPADEPASVLLRRTAFHKSATRRSSSRKVPTS